MGRSLRTVGFGWSIGFVVALVTAALTNRTGNPRLSAALFTAAGALALLVAVLMGIGAAAERVGRRGTGRESERAGLATWPQRETDAGGARPHTATSARPAPAAQRKPAVGGGSSPSDEQAAARIALLEARLALEEQQLQAAAEALAATDAEAAAHRERVLAADEVHPEAAEQEAALRQELLDAVAKLASAKRPDDAPPVNDTTMREAG